MVTLSIGLHHANEGWQFSCSFTSDRDDGTLCSLGQRLVDQAQERARSQGPEQQPVALTIMLHQGNRRLLDRVIPMSTPHAAPWTQVEALQMLVGFFSQYEEVAHDAD